MSKLENISALLVVTNSAFTKEAAFTTKTTRAELIRMLQAADFAVAEALEVAENYVKVSDQRFEDKEKLSAEVQELQEENDSYVMQLKHLSEKCSELEAKLETASQKHAEYILKNQDLEAQVSKQQEELVDADTALKASKACWMSLECQLNKYKQQGFFDRLFGRTPE